MVTAYRTNAYQPPKDWEPSFLDRLSYRLVGHYCLFVNMATVLMVAVPLWLAVFGFGYAILKIASYIYGF